MAPRTRFFPLFASLALLWVSGANGTDYKVQFGTPSANPGQTVNTGNAFNWTTWRSVGDPDGVNLVNNTGRTLKALHIKTSRNTDHFLVQPPTDNFFLKVWRKEDGREVIYSGGLIPATREFFSKVSRTDDFPIKILEGKVSDADILPENPKEWDLVYDGLRGQSDGWKEFLRNCPSEYRAVEIYAQSPDASICFVAKGRLLLYSAGTKTAHLVELDEALPGRINRIEVSTDKGKDCQFAIYHNGIEWGRLPCAVKKDDPVKLRPSK